MQTVEVGAYTIIRVDVTEEHYASSSDGKPAIQKIEKLIGAECLDTVNLRRNSNIMIVDDTGMIDGKPVNPKATALYHSICKPGTVYAIHGDVAIVNDKDFA